MKKTLLLLLLLVYTSQPLLAKDYLQEVSTETEALYRQGPGAEDGGFSAISLSTFGWGIGLAIGIAILCGVLHQSKAPPAGSQ